MKKKKTASIAKTTTLKKPPATKAGAATKLTVETTPAASTSADRFRCPWAKGDVYAAYHDREWGVPLHDDRGLFEFLVLDAAQAGLSWITILNKRESYHAAFERFDAHKIAKFDDRKIEELMNNPGIVRNRLKVLSAVANARAFLDVQDEFGSFDKYIWQFTGGETLQHSRKSLKEVPAFTPESDAMSKDLKKRGFKFVGTTICYAFMQAAGMVNDHLVDCFRHQEVQRF